MIITAAQIALIVGGEIEGNSEVPVRSFGKIEEAGEGDISFLANPKYEEFLYTSRASVIIINQSLPLKQPVAATLIKVPDAYGAFAILLEKYQQLTMQQLTGIEQHVHIHETAAIAENVFLGAFSYLSSGVAIGEGTKIYPQVFLGRNVQVGKNTIIHAGVKIYHDCKIGSNVIIHAGTVIGSDGFGFAPQASGEFKKIPQIGNVVVEDDVEIGANTTIDRATIGSTIIKSGVKLDNLIQIAHNVEIGNSTVIAAQAGISGSTKIGKGVMVGGQVGIVGHIHLGDGAKVNAQSGVTKSVEAGNAVTGSPAYNYTAALKAQAIMRQLPELAQKIKELEEKIATLEGK